MWLQEVLVGWGGGLHIFIFFICFQCQAPRLVHEMGVLPFISWSLKHLIFSMADNTLAHVRRNSLCFTGKKSRYFVLQNVCVQPCPHLSIKQQSDILLQRLSFFADAAPTMIEWWKSHSIFFPTCRVGRPPQIATTIQILPKKKNK